MNTASGEPGGIAGLLEALNTLIGRAVSWLTLATVLIYFTVVVLRYGFDLGWIGLQESALYSHSMVFMLAAAWTLRSGGHVRVDIFYSRWSERRRACADLFGSLFLLLPFALFLFAASFNYVAVSWRLMETSAEPGGLPLVWLLKSLIIVMAAQLTIQALLEARRALAVLRGR